MVRPELKRPVGNPISLSALPKKARPALTMPTRILSRQQERFHAKGLIFFAVCIQLAALGVTSLLLDQPRDAFVFVVVLCILAPWLFYPDNWRFRYKVMAVFAMGYAVVVAYVPLPLELVGCFAVAGLVCQGILFRNHYVGLALGTGLAKLNGRHNVKGSFSPTAFFDAVVQWLIYGIFASPLPGQYRSPAGTYHFRLTVSVMVLGLVALALNGCAVDAYKASRETLSGTQLVFVPLTLFAGSFLLPLPLIGLTCFVISAGILGKCYAARQAASRPDALAGSFYSMLDCVRQSKDKDEAASTPIGQLAFDQSVLWLPDSAVREHMWLSGATGAGKTAMILRLAESLLYRGPVSILALDLKADSFELYYSLEAAAEQLAKSRKQPVGIWRFTNRPGHASHLFSLFHQYFWKGLTPEQKADVLLDAMAIAYSREYGASWFCDAAHYILCFVVRKYPELTSFRHLHEKIEYELNHSKQNNIPQSVLSDGVHAQLIISRLAKMENMNDYGQHPKAVIDNAIQLDRLYRKPRIVYVPLPAMHSPVMSPEIGRIFLTALLKAALAIPPAERKVQVICIVDEFASILASNLELVLQQARSTNTSFLLANQTVGDLCQGTMDLTSCIEANTAVQLWFASIDQKGLDQIERLSGVTIEQFMAESVGENSEGRTFSKSYHEQLVSRLTANEITAAASREDQFICRIRKNAGFACYDGLPFVASTGGYHISQDEYERRRLKAWPAKTPDTIIVGKEPPSGPASHHTVRPRPAAPIVTTGTIGQSSLRKRTRPRS